MRLLALSDIHESERYIRSLAKELNDMGFKPDVALVAGDITRFKGVDTARRILVSLRNTVETRVLFVPGNCDSPQLLNVDMLDVDIINIHAKAYKLGDYVVYGVGGGGLSPFYTPIEFSEDDFESLIAGAIHYSNGKLIMVTHEPILGYFDDVSGVRIGSQVFATYLDKLKPVLWITGHVHENSGWIRAGETTIVHPGPFMKGFYAIIEIREGNVLVEIKRLGR
ncbi:MAG: metallophosphoesterase [Desulfurococcaceae archaeon]